MFSKTVKYRSFPAFLFDAFPETEAPSQESSNRWSASTPLADKKKWPKQYKKLRASTGTTLCSLGRISGRGQWMVAKDYQEITKYQSYDDGSYC